MTCSKPGCEYRVEARGLCCSHYAVALRSGEIKPTYVSRKWEPEELATMQAMRERGCTWRQIAVKLGRSESSVTAMNSKIVGDLDDGRYVGPPVERCPRCALAKPCNGCLPGLDEVASSRRGSATGL